MRIYALVSISQEDAYQGMVVDRHPSEILYPFALITYLNYLREMYHEYVYLYSYLNIMAWQRGILNREV